MLRRDSALAKMRGTESVATSKPQREKEGGIDTTEFDFLLRGRIESKRVTSGTGKRAAEKSESGKESIQPKKKKERASPKSLSAWTCYGETTKTRRAN